MIHLRDAIYKGHEYMLYQDGDTFTVDIREDAVEGDVIGGYYGISSVYTARRLAKAFIDGYEARRDSEVD